MTSTQNGWPLATAGQQDREPLIRDILVPNGVLAGDVAVVFRWLAQQYDTRVETLRKGTCWGWFVKQIEGGSSLSNHASGTAVDFNADRHPMGQAPADSFSAKQIAACRAIVDAAGGVLRWGGDYTGRKDAMHWEINASRARVAAFADKIRGEAIMAKLDDDDRAFITKTVYEQVGRYFQLSKQADGTPYSTVGNAVWAQGIPDPTKPADPDHNVDHARSAAWQTLEHIGESS